MVAAALAEAPTTTVMVVVVEVTVTMVALIVAVDTILTELFVAQPADERAVDDVTHVSGDARPHHRSAAGLPTHYLSQHPTLVFIQYR